MLHRLPLAEMISLVRARTISALELVNAHLNAFTMVLADQARESARRADQGLNSGALHGVPVTVKDSFDVAGWPTRLGRYFAPETPAAEDAAVVSRLRRGGALPFGEKNTPAILAGFGTEK